MSTNAGESDINMREKLSSLIRDSQFEELEIKMKLPNIFNILKIARKEIPVLVGEKKTDKPIEKDCTYPRRIVELIVDKFQIGLSSSDGNPLLNVPYEDRDGKVYYLGVEDLGLCMPLQHKETIIRMYTCLPSRMEDAKEHWKNW